jgi:putative methyltransferase (TIGR04325 family)
MMILKNFIKNLLPLFAYKFLKKILEKKKFTFIKKFSSYDEARSFTQTTDYIDEDLEISKTSNFHKIESFEFDIKHNLIPIIFSILDEKQSILEIGGGDNPALLYIEKAKINKNIFSSVIEKKSFVDKFEGKIPTEYKDRLEYKGSLNDIRNKKYDLVYFGSSIQYIVKHKDLFKDLFKFDPTHIVVSRTFFNRSNDEDYFVLQSNIASNLFPYKVMCLKKFIKFLSDNSYSLIYNVELPTQHKHEYLDSITYRDLIFKKK